MRTHPIKEFKYGIIDTIESHSIPDGAFEDNLNWLSQGDKVELRRGYTIYGTEDTGSYPTYVHTGYKADGTEVMFKKRGAELFYYNETTSDWVEIGTNLFTGAENDIPSFANYASNSGNMVLIGSTNSGLYKIMTANPGDYTNLYVDGTNYKGNFKLGNNRIWLWNTVEDKTGIYLSYIDTSNYTTVLDEDIGTTNGVLKTFTATLAFKAGSALRTCFGIYITCAGSAEVFEDNYNGVLVGSAGGTGTINYMTGAVSITYKDAPTTGQDILCDYQWENSNDEGITDFTYASPRAAGEGMVIRQDSGGGDIQNIINYNEAEYVFHKTKVWKVTFGDADTTTYNKIWRDNVGIANIFSAISTGDGIYYIDLTNGDSPTFRIMSLDTIAEEVIPRTITNNIDLSLYMFDKSAIFEFGDYILFSCRRYTKDSNETVFVYNKIWKTIDKLDWQLASFTIYNRSLIGASVTNGDVMKLFTNFVDNLDYTFTNYVVGNFSELGAERLKKSKKIVIEGDISIDQSLELYVSVDNSAFIKIGTIEGSGSYVDKTVSHTVMGNYLIGAEQVGGEIEDEEIVYHYKYGFKCNTTKFNKIQYKLVATGVGYLSVSMVEYWDIRAKTYKLPSKYR